jgi:tetratricopeptide (TPR) repeat protein
MEQPMGRSVQVTGDVSGQLAVGEHITQTQITNVYQQIQPREIDAETLAAAEAQLAALPLEGVPGPGALPRGSRMPLSPNPLFVGRAGDLGALAAVLKGGATVAIGQVRTAATTGLGGIGKTQLASEFVHRYGRFFGGGVFWLSFADPAAIPAEVAGCGGAGGLELRPDFEALPLEGQVRLVLAAWCSPLPRLLVFDNCEDEELLARWRPPSGGCRVLVTSRRGEWEAALGVRALRLDVLPRPESVALLRKHRPDLEAGVAEAIAAELGDLPLALHLAGSFLKRYRYAVRPDDYLEQLRDEGLLRHPSLEGRGAGYSPTGHEAHVARTFALSYARLDEADLTDALALKALARAAFFAAGEPIPRGLLVATLGLEGEEAALAAEDGLARLVELGLLEGEAGGGLKLHRLLAAFARGVADAAAQGEVEGAVITEARRLNEAGYPAPLLAWQPHLRAVIDAAQGREDETAAALYHELAHHLGDIGHYAAAQPYYERALDIREQVLGKSHPDTASTLDALGWLFYKQGDYEAASPYYTRALAIREQVLGGSHPDTATTLNNLGNLLWSQGKYTEAQSYCERALKIRRDFFGEEDPYVASSLNSLGNVHWSKKDYDRARDYYERALEIRKTTLGEIHPKVALSLRNLGALLYDQKDYEAAQPYFEEALTVYQKALLEEHPDAALVLNNLGVLFHVQGDYATAQRYYERALALAEEVLGSTHSRTRMVQRNLEALQRQTN